MRHLRARRSAPGSAREGTTAGRVARGLSARRAHQQFRGSLVVIDAGGQEKPQNPEQDATGFALDLMSKGL